MFQEDESISKDVDRILPRVSIINGDLIRVECMSDKPALNIYFLLIGNLWDTLRAPLFSESSVGGGILSVSSEYS